MEIFKSLSSAESWESEEDCPPLASEDSDIGDHREFEFLAAEQTKRRHIICSLVHSENNYLASLDRLVGEYKLEQILASHLQFRGALTEAVQSWDQVRGRTAAVGCLGLIRLFSGGENRRRLRELFFQV